MLSSANSLGGVAATWRLYALGLGQSRTYRECSGLHFASIKVIEKQQLTKRL